MIDIENNIIIHHLLSGFKFSHSIKRRPVSSSKFLTTNLHFLRMTSSSISLSTLVYLLYLLAKFPLTTPFSYYSKNTRVYFLKKNSFLQNNSESLLIFSIIPVEVKRGKARQLFVNNYLFRVMHPTT